MLAMAFLATAGLTSGCVATRKFVRGEVGTSANEISTKMDAKDRELEGNIQTNSGQITELSGVTREHGQKINTLDAGLKSTDEKASQAITVGQTAQSTATQAASNVSVLDQRFQNRNRYTVLSEESVPFKFDSATIESAHTPSLDAIAQEAKSNPDAILVLEGRTDATGDENYNIQLGDRRLESVIRYLVVEQGVPMHQVHKMSFGAAQPVASNDTSEGRAQNRSVIIRVMGPAAQDGSQRMAEGAR
jgi:outer membrane protein OmpA-like peptidoglycan-associated protein